MTLTTDDFIEAAQRAGFSMEELIQAETELQDVDKGTKSFTDSTEFHVFRASKILQEVAKDKALKHKIKPWKGPLPKPRISPP
jgi:hypothetical protein